MMGGVAILAGFAPFGPYPVNPTAQLAEQLDGVCLGEVLVKGVVMPATYLSCHHDVMELAMHYNACRIVTLGLATRVPRLRIETVGRNWMNSEYADAAGMFASGEELYTGSPQILSVNSDFLELKRNMILAGAPCEISQDAEGFVCNALIYHVLYTLSLLECKIPYVHLHTPWTDNNQSTSLPLGRPVLKWEVLERAAVTALTTLSLASNN